MQDRGIKKVIIPQEELLSLNLPDDPNQPLHYLIRYRVVSEDKSKISAWSPIHSLSAPSIPDIVGTQPEPSITSSTHTVTIAWATPTALKLPKYDIYVTWYQSNTVLDFEDMYVGSVSSSANNSFSLPKRDSANKISVRIQVSTTPKKASDNALVCKTLSAQNI